MRSLLMMLTLGACAAHRTDLEVVGSLPSSTGDVAIAAPQFLVDHTDTPFRANAVVGNITFSGGYITAQDGLGLHNVSKQVDITATDRYREQVTTWLTGLLPPTVAAVPSLPPPQAVPVRGTSPRDGKDNLSLPRTTYRPSPAPALGQTTLVPWVLGYYAHNGGWFYGQRYGTPAGARIRVLLALHGPDGAVLGSRMVDGSRISDRMFSPNEPELQDLLLALERRVGRKLD